MISKVCAITFLVFEVERSCTLAKVIRSILLCATLTLVIAYILSGNPKFRYNQTFVRYNPLKSPSNSIFNTSIKHTVIELHLLGACIQLVITIQFYALAIWYVSLNRAPFLIPYKIFVQLSLRSIISFGY